jgi:transcription initiation factor TFIIIB Brf1 subunit/transcription initiation factor TFIIB
MDSDFELFEELLELTSASDVSLSNSPCSYPSCDHSDTIDEGGATICVECGMQVANKVLYEKDWRYYGYNDSRSSADPNRCHIRKYEEKTIFKDVENMGFSEKIVNIANDIYTQVTKGKIFRGNSRKAIVFACIFHAYKVIGKPQSCDSIRTVFNLDRKIVLKGLKHVSLNAPKDSSIRSKYITPVELVEDLLALFKLPKEEHKENILSLYEKIRNKSSILNRSRPQSVASSLMFYYIQKKTPEFTVKEFVKTVKLSELTVNKISKEIISILDTPKK